MKGIKNGPFEWLDKAEHAFNMLRDVFTNVPILYHYNPEKYTPIFELIRKGDELDTPKGGEAQNAGVMHAVSGIHAVQAQHPAVEAKAKLLGYMLDAVNETRSSNVELDTPKGGEAQKAGVTHAVFGIHAV